MHTHNINEWFLVVQFCFFFFVVVFFAVVVIVCEIAFIFSSFAKTERTTLTNTIFHFWSSAIVMLDERGRDTLALTGEPFTNFYQITKQSNGCLFCVSRCCYCGWYNTMCVCSVQRMVCTSQTEDEKTKTIEFLSRFAFIWVNVSVELTS